MEQLIKPTLEFHKAHTSKVNETISNIKENDAYAFYWDNREVLMAERSGLIDLDMIPLSLKLPDVKFKVSIRRDNKRTDRKIYQNGKVMM